MSCYTVEQWIDYHLGNLPAEINQSMLQHKQLCLNCTAVSEEWEELTQATAYPYSIDEGKMQLRSYIKRVNSAGEQVERDEVNWSKTGKRRLKDYWVQYRLRYLLPITIVAASLLLLVSSLYHMMHATEHSVDYYAEKHEPSAKMVISDPYSKKFQVIHDALNVGYMWTNEAMQEMFLYFAAPTAKASDNYRVWGVADRNNHPVFLGMFQFHEGQAHLYVKEWNMKEIMNIVVRSEQKVKQGRDGEEQESIIVVLPQ